MANRECTISGVTISNDIKGNVEQALTVIPNVNERNIISLHINNGLFADYFIKAGKLSSKEELYTLNINSIKGLLNIYKTIISPKVEHYDAATHSDTLNGFEKYAIKNEAIEHTVDCVIDVLNDDLLNKRERGKNGIIKSVVSTIRKELIDRAKLAITDKEKLAEWQRLYDIKEELKEQYKTSENDENKSLDEINELRSKVQQSLETLANYSLNVLYNDRNPKNKNYAILYVNILTNPKWFDETFNKQRLLIVQNLFKKSANEEEWNDLNPSFDEDSNSFFEEFGEDMKDYTSQAWEDAIASSYLKYFTSRLSFLLSTLYNRDSTNINNKNKKEGLSNSTYLGVPTKMDARYVIQQIFRTAVGTNLKEFVDSVERLSKSAQSLYGVGELVNMMRNNNKLAYYVFAQFRKPLIAKNMVILNESGIDFSKTNREAFGLEKLTTYLLNDSNFTLEEVYSNKTVEKLKQIKKKFENIKEEDFLNSPVRESVVKELLDYIDINFPSLNKDWVKNALYKNQNAKENTNKFINLLIDYERGIKSANEAITKEKYKYGKQRASYEEMSSMGIEDVYKPEFTYKDEWYATRNKALIELATYLYDVTPVQVRYNSANAENHMSSDALKASYLTTFIDQVRTALEQGGDGLKQLKDFLTKSKFDKGENWYSTILFGISNDIDGKGSSIIQGMFKKKRRLNGPQEYEINRAFFDAFDISLFNGNKDAIENSGKQYENMTASDFLMAQMKAFDSHYDVAGRLPGSSNGFMNIMMRIPSDASNIYMIQVPRYGYENFYLDKNNKTLNTNNSIFLGFKQNLVGEVNEFINQLNVVFDRGTDGVWRLRKDTKNLFNVLHTKDDKLAEDGRLVGEVFKFTKLFNINDRNFDTNEEVIKLLNIYGNNDSLILERDGELTINTNHPIIRENDKGGGEYNLSYVYSENQGLSNIVDRWLHEYIEYIEYEKQNYSNITNNDLNKVNFEDFVLNTTLAYMSFDDIFEGSSKYYKDAQTFLKRAKETQMGGSIFGSYDINSEIGGELKNATDANGNLIKIDYIKGRTYVNGTLSEKDGDLYLRNGFRAVTITNTVNTSSEEMYEGIYEEIYKKVFADTNNKKIAKEVAEEIANGYGRLYKRTIDGKSTIIKGSKTKFNDAQSYITFEEFVRRKIADGTYEEYEDLIKQLSDDNVKLQDIDRDKLNKFIQVQKNVYYDIQYDPISGKRYPRQIKNAEFVLIPKLLAVYEEDGTIDDSKQNDLYRLYQLMHKYDIGQVNTAETSKAAQRNIITLWDNNGKAWFDTFERELYNGYCVENYYYRYLYKQQDIVSHISDSENKAGIQIMKKILDGYDQASKHIKNKIDSIQNAYSANIKSEFSQFLFNMGWEYRDGEIINKLTDKEKEGLTEEEIREKEKDLKFKEFYAKARFEAQRLGLDKNVLDFLTPEEDTGETELPKWMNNISTVLESIAQSIFNNRIIRQTLPGWHAVQVSNIGYADDLKYRPNGENVMEIKIAPWSKHIRDLIDTLGEKGALEQLQKEGLDEQVLYRIPTEGPQSMIVGKIKGFLPKEYDSTIVVAKEWVTQSGSDFDVDTIYNIRQEINKFGNKVKYNEDNTDEYLYERYVSTILNQYKQDSIDIYKSTNDSLNYVNDIIKDLRKRLKVQKQYGEIKNKIHEFFDKKSPKRLDKETLGKIRRIKYDIELENPNYTEAELNYYASLEFDTIENDNNIAELAELGDLYRAAFELENYNNFDIPLSSLKTSEVKDMLELARKERFDLFKSIAKKLNLMSFEEFSNQDVYDKMTEQERNTEIVESMISIIKDSSFSEGMLGRSNFDELTVSKKKNEELAGLTKISRSVYNPIDQNTFMQNAIDGRKLKAFSVNRDTLNSINAKLKTTIDEKYEIRVYYGKEGYDEDYIKNTFDTIQASDGKLLVRHRGLGWTKNGRNVIGRLLIPYSSQTTAHILDAIKEGALYNENDYTFGTFKTLLDTGVDTDTAICWLMQPGISLINKYYNANNSIFSKSYGNHQTNALREIALKLKLKGITKDSNRTQILKAFVQNEHVLDVLSKYGLPRTFRREIETDNGEIEIREYRNPYLDKLEDWNFSINKPALKDRLGEISYKKALSENDKAKANRILEGYLIHDFITILQFDRIHQLTDKVEKLGRVLRPESSGIKKSIRGTREFQRNVSKYSSPINPINNYLNASDVLNKIYSEDSQYKYLNYFYQYGILQSVKINSKLFETESGNFINLMDKIQAAIGHDISDEEYDSIKKSVINYVYSGLSLINAPIKLDSSGFIQFDDEIINDEYRDLAYWETEKGRINGYNVKEISSIKLSKEEFNNPSEEFVKKFLRFTPVQKVNFIKTHLDNAGIFNYLDCRAQIRRELKNQGYSQNRIYFNENSCFIDDAYNEFEQAFYSKNPLIRLAAIDLIKYAFVVEGMNYKRGSISKIIPNRVLLADKLSKGMGIKEELRTQFNSLFTTNTDDIIEKIVRSNTNLLTPIKIGEPTKTREQYKAEQLKKLSNIEQNDEEQENEGSLSAANVFEFYKDEHEFVLLPYNKTTESLRQLLKTEEKEYVLIKYTKNNRTYSQLYKIGKIYGYGDYLIPLNKLNPNEMAEDSINAKNNNPKILNKYYYQSIVKGYETYFANQLTDEQKLELVRDEKYQGQVAILNEFDIPDLEKFKYMRGTESYYAQKKYDKALANAVKIDKNVIINTLRETEKDEKNKALYGALKRFFYEYVRTQSAPFDTMPYGLILHNSKGIKSLLNLKDIKQSVIISLPYGGELVDYKISLYDSGYFVKRAEKGKPKNQSTQLVFQINSAYYEAWEEEGVISKGIKPTIYKIEKFVEPEIVQEEDRVNKENAEQNEQNAIFQSIKDSLEDDDYIEDNEETSELTQYIVNAIKNDYRRENDENSLAAQTLAKFRRRNINIYNPISINANKKSVYELALNYYKEKSIDLLEQLNNFGLSNGKIFSVNDLALYENLSDEDFNTLARLLLVAKSFGQSVEFLNNIPHIGEDEKTTKTVNDVLKLTSDVSNNPIVNQGLTNLFNYYISKQYSTNPLIRANLLNLTDNFGNIDKISKWVVSALETPQKQIQTIVKVLETRINASIIRGREDAREFEKQYRDLINKGVNINKIIDDQFRLIRPYTDKFIEDLNRFEEGLEAIGQAYGYNSKEYFEKALDYEKWRYKNLIQYLPDGFYSGKINIRESAYKKGKELFIKYLDLNDKIRTYEINGDLDEESKQELDNLITQKNELLNEYLDNGEEKSAEELEKIDAIKEYIQNIRLLYHKYFKDKEDKNWKRTLDYTLNVIKEFNINHPDLSNEEKLSYREYKIAYDWLKDNTFRTINPNTRQIIKDKYNDLKSHKEERENSTLYKIKDKYKKEGKLYDPFGEMIGTVFTDEEVKQIKDEIIDKLNDPLYSEDSQYSDSTLINDAGIGQALTDEFYRTQVLSDAEKDDEDVQLYKRKIITEINDILGKGFSKDTGHLDFDLLYDRCTEEELNTLIMRYKDLKLLYASRKNEQQDDNSKDKPYYTAIYADARRRFNAQLIKSETYNKSKKLLFDLIFCQTDTNGNLIKNKKGELQPNTLIYGNIALKTNKDGQFLHPEYFDARKTNAKKFLDENVEYKTTTYYRDALNKNSKEAQIAKEKALSEGKSEEEADKIAKDIIDKWFYDNHVYNKYSHKWEPLPIWTKQEIKEGSKLNATYEYHPSAARKELTEPKQINPRYRQNSYNYRNNEGDYNNPDFKLNDDEMQMRYLLEGYLLKLANQRTDKEFLKEGYVPRMYKSQINAQYILNQFGGVFGIQSRNYRDRQFKQEIDFANDSPLKTPMMDILKAQGYESMERYPEQGSLTDEEYLKYRKEIDERNKERKKKNRELEKSVIEKDWLKVFTNFIYNATINQEKERCKDLGYLVVEDLKTRKSYFVNNFDKVVSSKIKGQILESQDNSLQVFQNYLRKLLFGDYKELHKLVPLADTLQNMSSATFMTLNILGGMANINTGAVNILGEKFAQDYFTRKDYNEATAITIKEQFNFIRDAYSNEAHSKWSGFAKYFDIVEPDAAKQQAKENNKFNVREEFTKFNDFLYSPQSSGEYLMQNSVLFAMIKSHRVYTDIYTGKTVVGNLNDYLQNIEYLALREIIQENPVYSSILNGIKKDIQKDKNRSKDYDKLKRNLSQEFFKYIQDTKTRNELIERFNELRKEYEKQGKEEFNQLPKFEDQFIFDTNKKGTGVIKLKPDAIIDENNVGYFKARAFSVNQKIHGVYDKIGAAMLESKWFGSLVMQYHKHIYPGLMKRWRTNGYYNELRGTFEKGSYISFVQWIFSDFKNYKENLAKNKEAHENSIAAIESIRTVLQCLVNSFIDLSLNWKTLPLWEQRNIKRVYGDLCGVAASWLISFLIYLGWDDDEIKESPVLGSMLYLADRLLTETIMYTPTGLISEGKVLYKSPIAGAGGPQDLIKLVEYTKDYLFDEDFKVKYDRGTYKDMNKFGVLILKRTPIARQVLRFSTINKSNQYYRTGENNVSTKLIKNIVRHFQDN